MIIKVLESRSSTSPTLDYNYDKVAAGEANIIACRNLPSLSKTGVYETFERYEPTHYQAKRVSFHLAISPSETDTCSEEDIIDLVDDIMKHM